MKLLFLILAHDRPEQALELAHVLTAAASDGRALIHFDARAPEGEFQVLRLGAEAERRVGLVTDRVACFWGGFGLVEAPLAALAQAEAEGIDYDRVILLSGTCLPCRPISQLERYLAANSKLEFIESENESWMVDGLRAERHTLHHLLKDPRRRPKLEKRMVQIQRALGVRRRFPEGLSPRFGSQWWALSAGTCRAILADTRARPHRLRFFRTVWIPDETVFQTYVHALVPREQIAGFGLTHFQFTDRGKPVVLHDDHLDYVRTLPRFFVRKASPAARRLRSELLALAAAPDDGSPLNHIGVPRHDYAAKVAAQTWHPVPGQLFYRDQQTDSIESVLCRMPDPYVVLVGPSALTYAILRRLPEGPFMRLGEVFAPGVVDLGEGRESLGGLSRRDAPIRDLHPALFLTRLRARCTGVPVLPWSPLDAPALLERVLHDPAALCVACVPFSGNEARDRRLLTLALRLGLIGSEALPPDQLGLPPGLAARARDDVLVPPGTEALDWLSRDLFYQAGGTSPSQLVPMAWNVGGGAVDSHRRRRRLEAALEDCRFAARRWFPALVRGLHATWEAEMEEGLVERLYPDLTVRSRALWSDEAPAGGTPLEAALREPSAPEAAR